jgi:hypothetical protein
MQAPAIPVLTATPATRFVATVATAAFPTQIGMEIYTKCRRDHFGEDLTWRTARGAIVWLFGRWCFYLPLFFWRELA